MRILTTFPQNAEFEKAVRIAGERAIPHTVISSSPGYGSVGVPAIVIDEEDRARFTGEGASDVVTSGWVDYQPSPLAVPQSEPVEYEEDKFGAASIMVLRPCMADGNKLRITAHISGDLTEVFPYMNALMKTAFYNAQAQTFSFLETCRFITLYPRRIAIAKTDDIVDTWRVLEMLRTRFNECWKSRAAIAPNFERRIRPPALEIYSRLPKINCGGCGEKTCMAFACSLWSSQTAVTRCRPVFEGTHAHLKDALLEICAGLDVH
jgi:ArsR family metal-binding transcriptional regulator